MIFRKILLNSESALQQKSRALTTLLDCDGRRDSNALYAAIKKCGEQRVACLSVKNARTKHL